MKLVEYGSAMLILCKVIYKEIINQLKGVYHDKCACNTII